MTKANTKKRKLLALFLAVAMTFALLPLTGISAYAAEAPTITTTTLPYGAKDVPYSKQLSATGDTPITWSIAGNSLLPAGLTLSIDGIISGTPTEPGWFDVYVTATNGAGQSTNFVTLIIQVGGPYHTHIPKTDWIFDGYWHWHECVDEDGWESANEAHDYDDDSDAICNVCGYERDMDPRDPVYGIALSLSGTYIFPAQTVGYAAQPAKTATVTNTGERETGNLGVSLSGSGMSAFKVTGGVGLVDPSLPIAILIDSIAVGGNDTFSVAPVTGLAAGTYAATVIVEGDGFTKSFNVSFTVKPKQTVTIPPPGQTTKPAVVPPPEKSTKPAIVTPPAKTPNYTVKFNVNGGKALKKSLRAKAIKKGKTIGKLPTAARKNYKFKGWYTKKNGGKKATSGMKVTKNATLYARWQKLERYGKVVQTVALYVRTRPSLHVDEPPRVGTLKKGYTFKIKGFVDNKGTKNDWYKLTYKGKTGYIFAKYVKVVYK